eukprot:14254926-Alexandrium_andersonii.AAC.1
MARVDAICSGGTDTSQRTLQALSGGRLLHASRGQRTRSQVGPARGAAPPRSGRRRTDPILAAPPAVAQRELVPDAARTTTKPVSRWKRSGAA